MVSGTFTAVAGAALLDGIPSEAAAMTLDTPDTAAAMNRSEIN
jgi:hypothetical protein